MTRGLVLAAAVLACLSYRPAFGQLAGCAPDVERFCRGIPPGGGRLIRCLEGHGPQLSGDCKEAMGMKGQGSPASDACRSDAMKFCADAGRDRAKVKSCLVSHAAELSDGCKTAMIQAGGAGH